MEISKDALLRVVKATRTSMRQAKAMQMLISEEKTWTTADTISGLLLDALFEMSGEKLDLKQDFKDSNTMRLFTGDMSDEGVTDWLIMMDNIRRNHMPQEDVRQPKPQTMEKKEVRKLFKENGGYQSPEGEWP